MTNCLGESETEIRKFKECKKAVQKTDRQSYWTYINNIIETGDPDNDHAQPMQKRFWNYIKSLRKDSTGIAPLKDNGRLFNTCKYKADILNRQYQSVFTQEDPDTEVPYPEGKPYPAMNDMQVSEEELGKLLQKKQSTKSQRT